MNSVDQRNSFDDLRKQGRGRGFTLIELLVVVVVIAILAAVAIPSYKNFTQKARRSDAKEALLRVQIEQEKWRTNHTAYTTTLSDLGLTSSTSQGYYTIQIPTAGATGFTAEAAVRGAQVGDTACATIRLTVAAGAETKSPAACW